MTLRTNFRCFLDEEGKVLALTEQAKIVFKFLSKIVLSVSENIEQPLIQLVVHLTPLTGIVIPVKHRAQYRIGMAVNGIGKREYFTSLNNTN